MDNYEVLFLGKLIPKGYEIDISKKSKNVMQEAGNAFQWNIINGLDTNLGKTVDIYNMLPVGSYPDNYSEIFIKTDYFEHSKGSNDINIGFLNLAYVKHFMRSYFLSPHVLKWAKEKSKKDKVIISYDLDDAFLKCIKKAKKINPNIISCAIVPDLPQYIHLSKNKSNLLKIYSKYKNRKINRLLPYIDSFVVITEQMMKKLIPSKPYVVMECIAEDVFNDQLLEMKNESIKRIVYTGTLHERFGILHLLDAFSIIDSKDYRLIICGIGDTEEEIKRRAEIDNRIIFKGQVSRVEALQIQREATVLVNPRLNNEEFTKYSFPSKTMEYLASGIPVLAYKLDGIPDDYDGIINYIPDKKIHTLKNSLIYLCKKSPIERHAIGEEGRKFVLEKKNSVDQTRKIIALIDRINKKKI